MNFHTSLINKVSIAAFLVVAMFSCTKYEENLETANNESGIIRLTKNGGGISEAQIDEEFTIYAKLGTAARELEIYIADLPAVIVSRGTAPYTIVPSTGGQVIVQMDTINVIVPKEARIGPANIYLKVDGRAKPAMTFNIRRPDILLPNKVSIAPFVLSYYDSIVSPEGHVDRIFPTTLRNGGPLEAVVNLTARLTYDADKQVFYFLDYQKSDASLLLRMIRNGQITTIAGGGSDYFATTGSKLRLSTEDYSGSAGSQNLLDLEPGPEGKLYFTNCFTTDADPLTGKYAVHSLIQRIDPATGIVELVAGGKRLLTANPSRESDNYRGFIDGSTDTAMLGYPSQLTFGKDGELYFLDGWSETYGYGVKTLLRKLSKNGMIETVLGKINAEVWDFVDEQDGKTYQSIYYSAIEEHTDGFGAEVRFFGASKMVQAGNGKMYILSGGAGWNYNIVEVNLDTREASTILGLPEGVAVKYYTGTFKEVGIQFITALDVDFDGNLLYGYTSIYKMDLKSETVALLTSHAGGVLNKIVFDQFGNLYCGFDYVTFGAGEHVRASKVIIER
jgi:hypothetical protein